MKKTVLFLSIISLTALPAVHAETTVTVNDDQVTVNRAATPTVVVQQEQPVILTTTQDPRELEGEIIRVDYPESMIVVRDANGRERKVWLKQGMINNYKVDDYVKIYLMADMKEAKTIKTQ